VDQAAPITAEVARERQDAPMAPLTGAYGRYAMTVLLGIYVVNYLDRQVVNILAELIKHDLKLADWQLGLMTGFAFAGVYTVLGIPIARLADRGDRPLILGAALALWSVCTAACGLTQSFLQLLFARFGVGCGEAGGTPPAHSLIIDYVAPQKRGSALAFYGIGAPLGGLIAMGCGGLVADAWGWRSAFFAAAAPGLVLALLAALTLSEPRRRLARQGARPGPAAPPLGAGVRALLGKRTYRFLISAMAIGALISMGFAPFIASFFLRNHGAELAAAADIGQRLGLHLKTVGLLGLAMGLIGGGCGVLGMLCGGQLADRVARADPRRYMYCAAVSSSLSGAALVGALTAPSLAASLALYGTSTFCASSWYGPANAATYAVAPSNMRAVNSAISLFLSNMIGLGAGAVAVGLASDLIGAHLGAGAGIRWALVIFTSCAFIATGLFWTGARTFREDMATT
jgi:MFS family permease